MDEADLSTNLRAMTWNLCRLPGPSLKSRIDKIHGAIDFSQKWSAKFVALQELDAAGSEGRLSSEACSAITKNIEKNYSSSNHPCSFIFSHPPPKYNGTAGTALWSHPDLTPFKAREYKYAGRVAGARFDFTAAGLKERLIVLSLYLPHSGRPEVASEMSSITSYLNDNVSSDYFAPGYSSHLLVLGDLNSTHSPCRDRLTGQVPSPDAVPPPAYVDFWAMMFQGWDLSDTGTPGDITHVSTVDPDPSQTGPPLLKDAARLDYVLASPDLSARTLGTRTLYVPSRLEHVTSDHFPVLASFTDAGILKNVPKSNGLSPVQPLPPKNNFFSQKPKVRHSFHAALEEHLAASCQKELATIEHPETGPAYGDRAVKAARHLLFALPLAIKQASHMEQFARERVIQYRTTAKRSIPPKSTETTGPSKDATTLTRTQGLLREWAQTGSTASPPPAHLREQLQSLQADVRDLRLETGTSVSLFFSRSLLALPDPPCYPGSDVNAPDWPQYYSALQEWYTRSRSALDLHERSFAETDISRRIDSRRHLLSTCKGLGRAITNLLCRWRPAQKTFLTRTVEGACEVLTEPHRISAAFVKHFQHFWRPREAAFSEADFLSKLPKKRAEYWLEKYRPLDHCLPSVFTGLMRIPDDNELDNIIANLDDGAGGPSGLTNSMLKMLWFPTRLTAAERQELLLSHSAEELDKWISAKSFPVCRAVIRAIIVAALKGHIPPQLLRGQVCTIPKREGSTDLADLRPITLQEVTWKLVTGLLTKRLDDIIDKHHLLRGKNYGFCRRESTDPILFSLRAALEDAHQYQKPIFIGLGDIASAYDSVSWTSMEHSFKRLRMHEHPEGLAYMNLHRHFMQHRIACVLTARGRTDWFPVECGLPQGGIEAPLHWRIFFDTVLTTMEELAQERQLGYRLGATGKAAESRSRSAVAKRVRGESFKPPIGPCPAMPVAAFADDNTMIAESPYALQQMFDLLSEFLHLHGMHLNAKKTETTYWLPPGKPTPPDLNQYTVGVRGTPSFAKVGNQLKPTDPFRVLGVYFTATLNWSFQLAILRAQLQAAIATLSTKSISQYEFSVILHRVIYPRLAYPLRIVSLTDAQCASLDAIWLTAAKHATGLGGSTPNAPFESIFDFRTIADVQREQQWTDERFRQELASLPGPPTDYGLIYRQRLLDTQVKFGLPLIPHEYSNLPQTKQATRTNFILSIAASLSKSDHQAMTTSDEWNLGLPGKYSHLRREYIISTMLSPDLLSRAGPHLLRCGLLTVSDIVNMDGTTFAEWKTLWQQSRVPPCFSTAPNWWDSLRTELSRPRPNLNDPYVAWYPHPAPPVQQDIARTLLAHKTLGQVRPGCFAWHTEGILVRVLRRPLRADDAHPSPEDLEEDNPGYAPDLLYTADVIHYRPSQYAATQHIELDPAEPHCQLEFQFCPSPSCCGTRDLHLENGWDPDHCRWDEWISHLRPARVANRPASELGKRKAGAESSNHAAYTGTKAGSRKRPSPDVQPSDRVLRPRLEKKPKHAPQNGSNPARAHGFAEDTDLEATPPNFPAEVLHRPYIDIELEDSVWWDAFRAEAKAADIAVSAPPKTTARQSPVADEFLFRSSVTILSHSDPLLNVLAPAGGLSFPDTPATKLWHDASTKHAGSQAVRTTIGVLAPHAENLDLPETLSLQARLFGRQYNVTAGEVAATMAAGSFFGPNGGTSVLDSKSGIALLQRHSFTTGPLYLRKLIRNTIGELLLMARNTYHRRLDLSDMFSHTLEWVASHQPKTIPIDPPANTARPAAADATGALPVSPRPRTRVPRSGPAVQAPPVFDDPSASVHYVYDVDLPAPLILLASTTGHTSTLALPPGHALLPEATTAAPMYTYLLAPSSENYRARIADPRIAAILDFPEPRFSVVLDLAALARLCLSGASAPIDPSTCTIWEHAVRVPTDMLEYAPNGHASITAQCDVLRVFQVHLAALPVSLRERIHFSCTSPYNPIFAEFDPGMHIRETADYAPSEKVASLRRAARTHALHHPPSRPGAMITWAVLPKYNIAGGSPLSYPAWYWDEDLTCPPADAVSPPRQAYHRCNLMSQAISQLGLVMDDWASGPANECHLCHPPPPVPGPPPSFPCRRADGSIPRAFEYRRCAVPHSPLVHPHGPRYGRRFLPLTSKILSDLHRIRDLDESEARGSEILARNVLLPSTPSLISAVRSFFRLLSGRQLKLRALDPLLPKCLFLTPDNASNIANGNAPATASLPGGPDRPAVPISPTDYDYILVPFPPTVSSRWNLAVVSARLREIRLAGATSDTGLFAPLLSWLTAWEQAHRRPSDPPNFPAWAPPVQIHLPLWLDTAGDDAVLVMIVADYIAMGELPLLTGRANPGKLNRIHAPLIRERIAAALLLRDPDVTTGTVNTRTPARRKARQLHGPPLSGSSADDARRSLQSDAPEPMHVDPNPAYPDGHASPCPALTITPPPSPRPAPRTPLPSPPSPPPPHSDFIINTPSDLLNYPQVTKEEASWASRMQQLAIYPCKTDPITVPQPPQLLYRVRPHLPSWTLAKYNRLSSLDLSSLRSNSPIDELVVEVFFDLLSARSESYNDPALFLSTRVYLNAAFLDFSLTPAPCDAEAVLPLLPPTTLASARLVLAPILLARDPLGTGRPGHWVLLVLYPARHEIIIYDGEMNTHAGLESFARSLISIWHARDDDHASPPSPRWNLVRPSILYVPHQQQRNTCGLLMLLTADVLSMATPCRPSSIIRDCQENTDCYRHYVTACLAYGTTDLQAGRAVGLPPLPTPRIIPPRPYTDAGSRRTPPPPPSGGTIDPVTRSETDSPSTPPLPEFLDPPPATPPTPTLIVPPAPRAVGRRPTSNERRDEEYREITSALARNDLDVSYLRTIATRHLHPIEAGALADEIAQQEAAEAVRPAKSKHTRSQKSSKRCSGPRKPNPAYTTTNLYNDQVDKLAKGCKEESLANYLFLPSGFTISLIRVGYDTGTAHGPLNGVEPYRGDLLAYRVEGDPRLHIRAETRLSRYLQWKGLSSAGTVLNAQGATIAPALHLFSGRPKDRRTPAGCALRKTRFQILIGTLATFRVRLRDAPNLYSALFPDGIAHCPHCQSSPPQPPMSTGPSSNPPPTSPCSPIAIDAVTQDPNDPLSFLTNPEEDFLHVFTCPASRNYVLALEQELISFFRRRILIHAPHPLGQDESIYNLFPFLRLVTPEPSASQPTPPASALLATIPPPRPLRPPEYPREAWDKIAPAIYELSQFTAPSLLHLATPSELPKLLSALGLRTMTVQAVTRDLSLLLDRHLRAIWKSRCERSIAWELKHKITTAQKRKRGGHRHGARSRDHTPPPSRASSPPKPSNQTAPNQDNATRAQELHPFPHQREASRSLLEYFSPISQSANDGEDAALCLPWTLTSRLNLPPFPRTREEAFEAELAAWPIPPPRTDIVPEHQRAGATTIAISAAPAHEATSPTNGGRAVMRTETNSQTPPRRTYAEAVRDTHASSPPRPPTTPPAPRPLSTPSPHQLQPQSNAKRPRNQSGTCIVPITTDQQTNKSAGVKRKTITAFFPPGPWNADVAARQRIRRSSPSRPSPISSGAGPSLVSADANSPEHPAPTAASSSRRRPASPLQHERTQTDKRARTTATSNTPPTSNHSPSTPPLPQTATPPPRQINTRAVFRALPDRCASCGCRRHYHKLLPPFSPTSLPRIICPPASSAIVHGLAFRISATYHLLHVDLTGQGLLRFRG